MIPTISIGTTGIVKVSKQGILAFVGSGQWLISTSAGSGVTNYVQWVNNITDWNVAVALGTTNTPSALRIYVPRTTIRSQPDLTVPGSYRVRWRGAPAGR